MATMFSHTEPPISTMSEPETYTYTSSPSSSRSHSPSPMTSASMSPAANDSLPPSPGHDAENHTPSLQDQLYIAYSLDDLHLAKIILLKLKGISVTSPNDPRIAAVQPEDFDECFLPSGGLMSGKDDWEKVEEMRRHEKERLNEVWKKEEERRERERRGQWEKEMLRRWEGGKKKLREIKLEGLKRREEQRRVKEEEEQRRREKERRDLERREAKRTMHTSKVSRITTPPKSQRISYSSLSPSRSSPLSQTEQPFTYSFMITPSLQNPPPRRIKMRPHGASSSTAASSSSSHTVPCEPIASTSSHLTSAPPASAYSTPRSNNSLSDFSNLTIPTEAETVPFADVLMSMRGSLFPVTAGERAQRQRSKSSHHYTKSLSQTSRRQRRDAELLDSLLEMVKGGDDERVRAKGKERAVPLRRDSEKSIRTQGSASSSSRCAACSVASTSSQVSPVSSTYSAWTSSSATESDGSSVFSRRTSWLSFGGSVSSSVSTALTTPSPSPKTPSFGSWFKPSANALSIRTKLSPLVHSCCRRPYSHLTPISLTDSPLSFDDLPNESSSPSSALSMHPSGKRDSTRSTDRTDQSPARSLVRHVSRFVELAKGFQNAYVGAMVYGAVPTLSGSWDDEDGVRSNKLGAKNESSRKMRLRPAGYRVRAGDVMRFVGVDANAVASSQDQSLVRSTSSSDSSTSGPAKTEEPESEKVTYILLTSPYPPAYPPRTVLPCPLPYPVVFKPPIPIIPSPLRRFAQLANAHASQFASSAASMTLVSHTRNTRSIPRIPVPARIRSRTPSPPRRPIPRQRCIANPAYLRLKALQNIVWERGVNWEGRSRDGMLGCGREKVLGRAYEELGRSCLSASSAETYSEKGLGVGGERFMRAQRW